MTSALVSEMFQEKNTEVKGNDSNESEVRVSDGHSPILLAVESQTGAEEQQGGGAELPRGRHDRSCASPIC